MTDTITEAMIAWQLDRMDDGAMRDDAIAVLLEAAADSDAN